MHDPRYPVVPTTHPYTLAVNRDYSFLLSSGAVRTATYKGVNSLGFWVVAMGSVLMALNPERVVLFTQPQPK